MTKVKDIINREAAMYAACRGLCHPGPFCPDSLCWDETKYIRELSPAVLEPESDGVLTIRVTDASEVGRIIIQDERTGKAVASFVLNKGGEHGE